MTDALAGFFAPWLVYGLILALHLALPARQVDGYIRDPASGAPLVYRLNGPAVLAVIVGLWALSGYFGLLPWDWLYRHRWPGLAGACALGLIFSVAMVGRGGEDGSSLLSAFYAGRLENPRFFSDRVDVKMFLYLAGAVMLALNILSFYAHHLLTFGDAASPGVAVYCFLFLWFLLDYLTFERVHLYTYDIFAERMGFKLGWGCLVFYPYFYAIGLWAAADLPDPGTSPWLLVAFRVLFFAGWVLSRGANLQKFYFKLDPERPMFGILKPKALSDGSKALLYSGFWGLSRHVNYLGEILMAVALTLCLGWPLLWAAWLYPLYYLVLLLSRQRADERRCAAKYGELWTEYVRRVPKRIVPGIY